MKMMAAHVLWPSRWPSGQTSTSRAGNMGIDHRFFLSSDARDLNIDTLVSTLTSTWCSRIRAITGRPDVNIVLVIMKVVASHVLWPSRRPSGQTSTSGAGNVGIDHQFLLSSGQTCTSTVGIMGIDHQFLLSGGQTCTSESENVGIDH